ncbi:MAG: cell division protein SepF [Defluviitaleaceae bacterium]|nr:cell division protein SepF [Defluviitaleaceae bacterium]
MSFKDKMKSLIGIDDEDFFEEEFELPNIEPPVMNATSVNTATPLEPRSVMNAGSVHVQPQPMEQMRTPLRAVEQPQRQTNNRGQVSAMNVNAMMNKVIIREPKDYSDAQNIADCLKESLPVFVNLQRLDKGQGRRVIDFLSGTIYAVDGEIQRVGNDLFLCTPKSVETDGEVTETTNDELSLGEL